MSEWVSQSFGILNKQFLKGQFFFSAWICNHDFHYGVIYTRSFTWIQFPSIGNGLCKYICIASALTVFVQNVVESLSVVWLDKCKCPYLLNLVFNSQIVSSPLWSWCRAGWVFTDCFLLLSGALTAHRISDGDTGAPWRLFTRYLRYDVQPL